MKKQFFYEFNGRVLVKANDQDGVEKQIMGISPEHFIIDEDIYQVDEDYIAVDLNKRKEKMGTHFHPMDDHEEYENFRRHVRRYGKILREFLNGEINRSELIKKMDQDEDKEIDDGSLIYQVQMVDLETKEGKTANLVPVD